MKKIIWGLAVLASVSLPGCANYTTVREHKNLQDAAARISSVAILPADVSIELIAFTGENEKETEKEATFAQQLQEAAKVALESKQLKVVDFDFTKGLVENQNLAFAITQCKEALTKAEANLYKKAVDVKEKGKFAESVGASANVVAEATGADAMLVIDYKGFEKTAGMKAKDVAAGVLLTLLVGQTQIATPEGSRMQAALIATDSGDILWTNLQGSPALNTAVSKPVFDGFPKVAFRQVPAAPIQAATAEAH